MASVVRLPIDDFTAAETASGRQPLVALTLQGSDLGAPQPVSAGLPLPRSLVKNAALSLHDEVGKEIPLQATPLATWPDGSLKWVLLDCLVTSPSPSPRRWTVCVGKDSDGAEPRIKAATHPDTQELVVETGAARFQLDRQTFRPFTSVLLNCHNILQDARVTFTDADGVAATPVLEQSTVEAVGPVRTTIRFEGSFTDGIPCRFVARLCFFAGTRLVRLRFTLHNPRRARHPGGLWDLGDAGSVLFRDLSLHLRLADRGVNAITYRVEPNLPVQRAGPRGVAIYQDSSGGANWQSRNHLNRDGEIPLKQRGYVVESNAGSVSGLRANPVVSIASGEYRVTAAIPEFWQQFPKAIEASDRSLVIRLFPKQFSDLHELQGGERKTHVVWLDFGKTSAGDEQPLGWVREPATWQLPADWYSETGVLQQFHADSDTRLDGLLEEATEGDNDLLARRETIDEYGWRNFGDTYADHEAAFYKGTTPHVSHYNNQYDLLQGALLQGLRTGKSYWRQLYDPLARHVLDVDLYHTDEDKAAYNHGLFWFTDHYLHAETCTHRTYSKANVPVNGGSYGGGPSSEHLFTSGLLLYHYLSGDPLAAEGVLELADWVLAMDDGRRNVLGLLDGGPTGFASKTASLDYQGPGRGPGNSINALLDAWQLTGAQRYLEYAEVLLKRCVHPSDDVASLDLLNVEKRWSYTVFLTAVARFLNVKAECAEIDEAYGYAQASLLHYAAWMVEHERPYLDKPEALEYPTEVWAAQELRKANVLRQASEHASEPLHSRLLRKANELAERGWSDLGRFDTRTNVRCMALVMNEGTRDAWFRANPPRSLPRWTGAQSWPLPVPFTPQKTRVMGQLRSPCGLLRGCVGVLNPRRWRDWLGSKRDVIGSIS